MSILLFTAAPEEIARQMTDYLRRNIGITSISEGDVIVNYQQNVLRQMNIITIKSMVTKVIKLIIGQHTAFRIAMSRSYNNNELASISIRDKYSKAYLLAVSHYPELISLLEKEASTRFGSDPRLDYPELKLSGQPTDIEGRYYLFLLAR